MIGQLEELHPRMHDRLWNDDGRRGDRGGEGSTYQSDLLVRVVLLKETC